MTHSWPPDELSSEERVAAFDTNVANPARMWNYWVGGKDNISQEVRADFRNRNLT